MKAVIPMRYLLLIAAIFLPVMCISVGCTKATPDMKAVVQHWHCPMHPDYIKDKPGSCPLCNMDLVPIGPAEVSADGSIVIDPAITVA